VAPLARWRNRLRGSVVSLTLREHPTYPAWISSVPSVCFWRLPRGFGGGGDETKASTLFLGGPPFQHAPSNHNNSEGFYFDSRRRTRFPPLVSPRFSRPNHFIRLSKFSTTTPTQGPPPLHPPKQVGDSLLVQPSPLDGVPWVLVSQTPLGGGGHLFTPTTEGLVGCTGLEMVLRTFSSNEASCY